MQSRAGKIYEVKILYPTDELGKSKGVLYHRIGGKAGLGVITSIEKNEDHFKQFGVLVIQIFKSRPSQEGEVLWKEIVLPAPVEIIYDDNEDTVELLDND